jgi:transposase-like protein
VTDTTPKENVFDVVCPHCRKPFQGALLAGRSVRHAGFKCPHCRLFVAYERGEED